MRLLCGSDFHGSFPKLPKNKEPIDLLILAGDIPSHDLKNFTFMLDDIVIPYKDVVRYHARYDFRKIDPIGEGQFQHDWAMRVLSKQVETIKPKHIIYVNGNHEFLDPSKLPFVTHGLKTGSKTIEIDGVKIGLLAGSMPFRGEWSDETPELEMQKRIMAIEPDIDILVSHVPPNGMMDLSPYGNVHIGCSSLYNAIVDYGTPYFTNLKHHFFGHAHEAQGDSMAVGVDFHNVSKRWLLTSFHK